MGSKAFETKELFRRVINSPFIFFFFSGGGGGGGGGVGGGGAQCAEPVDSTPHRMFVTGVPHITNFGQVVPLSSR